MKGYARIGTLWTLMVAAFFFALIPQSQANEMDGGGGWYCESMYVMGQYQGQTCEWRDSYGGGGGGGGGGYDEGGGGGGGGGYDVCPYLLQTKPANCNGPEVIAGSHWGLDKGLYSPISGIRRFLESTASPSVATRISNALALHTNQLALQSIPSKDVHATLILELQEACRDQVAISGSTSTVVSNCWSNLNRLISEYEGTIDSIRNFLNSIGLPPIVVDLFSVDNSLTTKQEAIRSQVQCNLWHQQVQANGC